jgi:4-aminobutyrate aminotransferase/(S)-3-amino-2-methylpropionate transaminase
VKLRKIPGPKSLQLARRLAQVESKNITYLGDDFPVFWESARGSTVSDVDGNRFLDLTSAFGVASLGHSAPAIHKAITRQTRKIWHGMGDVHPSAVKVKLLETLAAIAPKGLTQSILSSSGAEAVESALKTARLATGKRGVIAFDGAYHGLSYGALGATDRSDFKTPFADQLPAWITHSAYPDSLRGHSEERCLEILERFLKAGNHPAGPFGAILVEPIQGRGGVRVPKPEFLQGLRELCNRFDLVLIADEIFTGLGRTGKMFGIEHAGVLPDLACLGKALSNGFPLSACIGTERVMGAWPISDGEAIHTSTFLGNPLGCAMALAALDELKTKRLSQRAASLGEHWMRQMQAAFGDHLRVAEIRGQGLMIGIELVTDRKTLAPDPELAVRVLKECLQQGLLVLSGGSGRNVLTLTPPLTISEKQLGHATRILKEVFQSIEKPQSNRKLAVSV